MMDPDTAPRAAIGAALESSKDTHYRGLKPIDWANPHPIYVVWEITLKCDLGCKHCGSRAGHVRDHELSTERCLQTVDELAAMGVREVTLIGGEAYLRDDWDIIARAITDKGMAAGMTTGARNLTDERIHLYRAWGLTPGAHARETDEFLEVHVLPLSRLMAMALDGTIIDAKTLVTILAINAGRNLT